MRCICGHLIKNCYTHLFRSDSSMSSNSCIFSLAISYRHKRQNAKIHSLYKLVWKIQAFVLEMSEYSRHPIHLRIAAFHLLSLINAFGKRQGCAVFIARSLGDVTSGNNNRHYMLDTFHFYTNWTSGIVGFELFISNCYDTIIVRNCLEPK